MRCSPRPRGRNGTSILDCQAGGGGGDPGLHRLMRHVCFASLFFLAVAVELPSHDLLPSNSFHACLGLQPNGLTGEEHRHVSGRDSRAAPKCSQPWSTGGTLLVIPASRQQLKHAERGQQTSKSSESSAGPLEVLHLAIGRARSGA